MEIKRAEYFKEEVVKYIECYKIDQKKIFLRIFHFGNRKLLMNLTRGISVKWKEYKLNKGSLKS